MRVIGRIGAVQFARAFGQRSFSVRERRRFAKHDVIDGKPRLQDMGADLAEAELEIKLDRSFCDPDAELTALEAYRNAAQGVPIFDVAGGATRYQGLWVIDEIETEVRGMASDALESISVFVRLMEFVPSSDVVVRAQPQRGFVRETQPRPAPSAPASSIPPGEIVRR